jgi:hypothetical protein
LISLFLSFSVTKPVKADTTFLLGNKRKKQEIKYLVAKTYPKEVDHLSERRCKQRKNSLDIS